VVAAPPRPGKPVDPSDEAALRRRERELRDGGVWLDYSWVFVLRPLGEDRTRLLVRCRADLAPRAAWPLGAALGLVDAYETIGMLHGIKARAERLAVTGRPERAAGRTRPRRAGQGRRDHGREADDRPGDDGAPPPHGRPGRAPAASLQHQASPVVDEQDRLVGIVSRGDLLRVFLRRDHAIREEIEHDLLTDTLGLAPAQVTVAVRDGKVDLHGLLECKSVIPILVRLCRMVDGVVAVRDRLSYRVDDSPLDRLGV
jgi:hypothetical protein